MASSNFLASNSIAVSTCSYSRSIMASIPGELDPLMTQGLPRRDRPPVGPPPINSDAMPLSHGKRWMLTAGAVIAVAVASVALLGSSGPALSDEEEEEVIQLLREWSKSQRESTPSTVPSSTFKEPVALPELTNCKDDETDGGISRCTVSDRIFDASGDPTARPSKSFFSIVSFEGGCLTADFVGIEFDGESLRSDEVADFNPEDFRFTQCGDESDPTPDDESVSDAGVNQTATGSSASRSPGVCEPVVIEEGTDNLIDQITVEGIDCEEAASVLADWGRSGYPGEGPEGFECIDAERPLNQMTQSTGLRCSRGEAVITFGGSSQE